MRIHIDIPSNPEIRIEKDNGEFIKLEIGSDIQVQLKEFDTLSEHVIVNISRVYIVTQCVKDKQIHFLNIKDIIKEDKLYLG